jgi:hypothetical protein
MKTMNDDNIFDDPLPAPEGFMTFRWPAPTSTGTVADTLIRTTVSADAVLTPADVVHMIGGREGVVRNWLRDAVQPLRHPSGRTVYRWGDVLTAMSRAA